MRFDKDVHTAVYAEYFVVDDDRQREEIKHIGEVCPHAWGAVFSMTFRVETICLASETSALMSVS